MCQLKITEYKCGCARSHKEKWIPCRHAAYQARAQRNDDDTTRIEEECPAPEKLTDEEQATVRVEGDECPGCAAESKRRRKEQNKNAGARERKEKKDERERKKREMADQRERDNNSGGNDESPKAEKPKRPGKEKASRQKREGRKEKEGRTAGVQGLEHLVLIDRPGEMTIS